MIEAIKERASTLKALSDALVPLLRRYREVDGHSGMPEAFQVGAVAATGFMGGDAGHGGNLQMRLYIEGGANTIVVTDEDGENPAGVTLIAGVTLSAEGDWEQAGLICALMEILEQLLPIFNPDLPQGSKRHHDARR